MAPAVKRELPPFSSRAARSSISTEAPASRAASAAQKAALPAPTTTTSHARSATPASERLSTAGPYHDGGGSGRREEGRGASGRARGGLRRCAPAGPARRRHGAARRGRE